VSLQRQSHSKVNLLLNVLGRRPDGFHELESLMLPIPLHDTLHFLRVPGGIHLTCDDPTLAVDSGNLVHRAAACFLEAAGIRGGVRIHLEKRVPMAAGLGGGSGNAATTLLALNDLFDRPLSQARLAELAAQIGSDVPFFLHHQPALVTGRGERVQPLPPFPTLAGAALLLVRPAFGIPTPWAYAQLAHHPAALNGRPGRASQLAALLTAGDLAAAGRAFYNSLEAPALLKFPLLALFQDFFREHGALGTLMSGSGSTTFALLPDRTTAEALKESFVRKFGPFHWTAVVTLV
jgi:4-diphosphocytidyl-2-C-methyl-D-erythritol kinase